MAEENTQDNENDTNMSIKKLLYKPFTSLQQLASVKVGESILRQEISDSILDNWPDLREKCLSTMRMMRFDLHNFYQTCRIAELKDYKNIIWTPSGQVDVIKTFRNIKPKLEPNVIFNVACQFGLYEDWLEVAHNIDIEKYESEDIPNSRGTDMKLFNFFKNRLKCGPPSESDIADLISHSVKSKHYYPVLNLWHKLKDEQKPKIIDFYIHTTVTNRYLSQNIINLFQFFFEKMNEKECEEFFKLQPVSVLYCLWSIYPNSYLMKIIRFFIRKKYLLYEQAILLCTKFTKCRCLIFSSFCKHNALCPENNLQFAHMLFNLVLNEMEYFGKNLAVYPTDISLLLQEFLFYTKNKAEYMGLILTSRLVQHLVFRMAKGEDRQMKETYIDLLESWTYCEAERFMWVFYIKLKFLS